MSVENAWLTIGFFGQIMFTLRFVVQWVHSERRRESVIPVAFWYFSIAGGVILFAYAVHRRDPVFIVGQSAGIIVYLRNLYFIRLKRSKAAPDARTDA